MSIPQHFDLLLVTRPLLQKKMPHTLVVAKLNPQMMCWFAPSAVVLGKDIISLLMLHFLEKTLNEPSQHYEWHSNHFILQTKGLQEIINSPT